MGEEEKLSKLVFLPNLPSVSLVLFKIKHLIDIKPVTFPNGIPEDFSPETHGYRLKPRYRYTDTGLNQGIDTRIQA